MYMDIETAKELKKKLQRDIYSDKQYLVTADGSNARILITQDKNYKWVAKLSNASDSYKGSSLNQMGNIISDSMRKKKK